MPDKERQRTDADRQARKKKAIQALLRAVGAKRRDREIEQARQAEPDNERQRTDADKQARKKKVIYALLRAAGNDLLKEEAEQAKQAAEARNHTAET